MGQQQCEDMITKALSEASPKARSVVEMVQEILSDGGKRIDVTFRRPVEIPTLAKTPRRSHVFESIHALCNYLEREAKVNAVALLDGSSGEACVVLDEGKADGVEQVYLKPVLHPLLTPWSAMVGRVIGSQEFLRVVSDNRRTIQSPTAAELISMLRQLRIHSSKTVEVGEGSEAVNGVMVKTTIKGVANETEVGLPQTLSVQCPLFIDAHAREISFDLFVLERKDEDDPIGIRVSSSDLAVQKLEEISLWSNQIKSAMPEGAVVGFGKVQHREWEYVK
jgi:hypothetical protein